MPSELCPSAFTDLRLFIRSSERQTRGASVLDVTG